ncbi:MAG: hypothetical protein R3C01_12095 [Planctomycetaceae bacterium]
MLTWFLNLRERRRGGLSPLRERDYTPSRKTDRTATCRVVWIFVTSDDAIDGVCVSIVGGIFGRLRTDHGRILNLADVRGFGEGKR